MPLGEILTAFNDGLGNGAKVAISYAVLGAFAVALSRSGITQLLSNKAIAKLGLDDGIPNRQLIVFTLLGVLLAAAVSSQNLIPVHIAFIPVLVPPLLKLMNHLQLDRRAVACVITFGITAPYMLLPVGFGSIFLHDILLTNLNENGLDVTAGMVPMAMIVPIGGMALGLVVALLFSYRRKRDYQDVDLAHGDETPSQAAQHLKPWQMLVLAVALVGTVTVQLFTGSMVIGGLFGFALLSVSGVFRWHEQDDIFTEGMRMMALVGFIMISAAGFASVMQASGQVEALVASSTEMIGDNKGLAALIMLLVGLFITMGIGSSFSTIPIIASLYVPWR